eukprot:TRINITY_DN24957_c0_g2_i2.p1 TRINITY_DN24957_c0_g2~~TRINITY_DN24957_c0_g2_i2.p1  ORF type:complete len:896 (+),score=183.13 TRINITY_DN24957_c0_g2_i2:37-2724(+)
MLVSLSVARLVSLPGRCSRDRWQVCERLAGLHSAGACRTASSLVRKRRRVYYKALKDPTTHPGTLRKFREAAAIPSTDDLRYIAEKKIGKPLTTEDRRAMWFDVRFKRYAPVFLGQFKPQMRFWTGALNESQLPLPRLPEVAIAGRSNSGKSTLVNYLCGQHSAKVKRTPGSTTELVFWQIGKPAKLCLVDLPGYGFADAPEETRLQWTEFSLWYLRTRKNLRRVLLLVDARWCLKPSDKEMIAYLERHKVKWQVIVTKCDKVKPKDLAKKLTVLKEDLKGYYRMAGEPIPISALKKQGMDRLRGVLDHMKVQSNVTSEGIQRRIYDLLEERRLRRADKLKRRRERKREEEEGKAEEERLIREAAGYESGEDEGQGDSFEERGDLPGGGGAPDLHGALEDYFNRDAPAPSAKGLHAHADAAADGVAQGDAAMAGSAPTEVVLRTRAPLPDDRDVLRVEGFARDLFPDLPPMGDAQSGLGLGKLDPPPSPIVVPMNSAELESTRVGGRRSRLRHNLAPLEGEEDKGVDADVGGNNPGRLVSAEARGRRLQQRRVQQGSVLSGDSASASVHGGDDFGEYGSESDSDQDFDGPATVALPPVMRWEPALQNQQQATGRSTFAGAHEAGSDSRAPMGFPDFGDIGGPKPQSDAQKVRLRQGWARPSGSQDRIYEYDDFASKQDFAAGKRPHSPPAPSEETRGNLVAEARRRYEREWAMELDDVESQRVTADGVPLPASASLVLGEDGRPVPPRSKRIEAQEALAAASTATYIGKRGATIVPKGRNEAKVVGRRPSRILKEVRAPDAAKAFGFKDKRRTTRRNFGDNLTFDEAESKWNVWYERHKSRSPERILMAGSPQKEDVEADYEERVARLRRRPPRGALAQKARGADDQRRQADDDE